MQFLRGDAHFRAQSELEAVGKAGARIAVNGGAVHFVEKFLRGGGVFGDDAVAVVGAVLVDVRDRLFHTVHDLDRDLQRQKFRRIVLFGRGRKVGKDRTALFTGDDLHIFLPQRRHDRGKMLARVRLVDEKALAGVAHGCALRLGIDQDGDRLRKVRRLFKVDMAVARTRFDDGDNRVLHRAADERGAPARDEHVNHALHAHELRRTFVRRVLDELDELGVIPLRRDRFLDDRGDGAVGTDRVFAAAQNDGVAALDRKADRVCGDVGARLVNDADHAERHAHTAQLQSVIERPLFQHFSHGTGKLDQLFQSHGDAVDALFVQHQTVDELRAARAARYVLRVFGNDKVGAIAEGLRRRPEHCVHVLFARKGDRTRMLFRFPASLGNRHFSLLFALGAGI